jgi:phage tail sheath protein FI
MPTLSYPGVYIQEVPSGQHTITGVATSIAAFIGWANMGPVREPVMIESWAQYQSTFGGMIPGAHLGYAVSQFFQNGGSQVYVIRLAATNAKTAASTIGGLKFAAIGPGLWGNSLWIEINNVTATSFNLVLTQLVNGQRATLESYTNLTVSTTDSRYAATVINNDSSYIRIVGPTPLVIPTAAAATALDAGASPTVGGDGDMLVPQTPGGPFETALNDPVQGYQLLTNVPIFNILAVPGETALATVGGLQAFCLQERAFLIVDSDANAIVGTGANGLSNFGPSDSGNNKLNSAPGAINSAFYFPWVMAPDPAVGFRPTLFPPSGFVAGIYAATDASRGVWKAPAGSGAGLTGAVGLQTVLSDLQQGALNPQGVNCLRQFPSFGNVVYGARTIAGSDIVGSEWKYVPIRRFTLFLESSLYNGTQWAVFEPNAAPLWAQVRLSVGAFMQDLFLKGALAGTSPQQAYFVKCDAENNPGASIAAGVLNIMVGFAPLYPAEFIVIQIQQMIQS